ncbi:MAG: hypothetical protein ACXWFB_08570 [Nitrososphaeraceae archaeon]
MGKKKKEIKIIRKDSNKEEYTFISSDNILNNTKNESINNEIKSGTKPNDKSSGLVNVISFN